LPEPETNQIAAATAAIPKFAMGNNMENGLWTGDE